jgi:hypothetical protein
MPFQPCPGIAQVRLIGSVDRQETVNDLYFAITGGSIDSSNLAVLTAAVAFWWQDTLIPVLSDDWTGVLVEAVDLTSQFGASASAATPAPGGASGEANPNNVAMCVSFRTGLRGRSFRGRNYVPGIPGAVVTLNTLDAGFILSVLGAYNALVGPGLFLAGWQWVVLSRRIAGSLRAEGVGTPVTAAISVTDSVRSMRTREVGKGA